MWCKGNEACCKAGRVGLGGTDTLPRRGRAMFLRNPNAITNPSQGPGELVALSHQAATCHCWVVSTCCWICTTTHPVTDCIAEGKEAKEASPQGLPQPGLQRATILRNCFCLMCCPTSQHSTQCLIVLPLRKLSNLRNPHVFVEVLQHIHNAL